VTRLVPLRWALRCLPRARQIRRLGARHWAVRRPPISDAGELCADVAPNADAGVSGNNGDNAPVHRPRTPGVRRTTTAHRLTSFCAPAAGRRRLEAARLRRGRRPEGAHYLRRTPSRGAVSPGVAPPAGERRAPSRARSGRGRGGIRRAPIGCSVPHRCRPRQRPTTSPPVREQWRACLPLPLNGSSVLARTSAGH